MLVLRCQVLIVVYIVYFSLFFFFKQKTAYEMRISDWSSDVCSSDLVNIQAGLIKKIGQVDGADTQLLALPLYCLIKRGVRAIENLADYGEEKIFSKYEKRLLLILDDLSLFILRRDDLSFYLQGGIKFTENEVTADRKSTRLNSSH